MSRILVGDDLPHICDALALLLKAAGHRVDVANSPQELLIKAQGGGHELILMDMNYARDTTSGEEGLDLLDRLQEWNPGIPVVVMTAWSTVEIAVQAMQRGARDFVTKPWDNQRLIALIEKHVQRAREVRQAHQREKSERELARDVQQRFLPKPQQRLGRLMCECVCRPARDVGGDLYDVLDPPAFVIADVCGKGMGSALMMASLQATIRAEWDGSVAPEDFLKRVNRLFYKSTRPEHFATLFFGAYDEGAGMLRYVNCGHPEPVLARAGGSVERLEPTGTVVGAFAEAQYESRSVPLDSGDVLLLFSDGVIEAPMGEEEFGDQRLVDSVVSTRAAGPAAILDAVLKSVIPEDHDQQYDDVTMMAIAVS